MEQNFGRIITNRIGSYLWLTSGGVSRYEGFFVRRNENLYKILDNLVVAGEEPSKLKEEFILPRNSNKLIYRLEKSKFVNVFLDVRKSYSSPRWGRFYDLLRDYGSDDEIWLRYHYRPGKREGKEPLMFYVVFKSSPEPFYSIYDKWVKRKYFLDKKRNSEPYSLYIYKAFRVRTKKLEIGVGSTKSEARDSLWTGSSCANSLSRIGGKSFVESKNLQATQTKGEVSSGLRGQDWLDYHSTLAYNYAKKNLRSLFVSESEARHRPGIYAGLPWFFQFWSRDELISLKPLLADRGILDQANDPKAALTILRSYLRLIGDDGRIPNIRSLRNEPSFPSLRPEGTGSADGVGWLFLRLGEVILADSNSALHLSDIGFLKDITASRIKEVIEGLLDHHTDENGLAVNGPKETWMDTEYKGDSRSGACLEVQALRLNMYSLAYELTFESKYKKLESELRKKVKDLFWTGDYLKDKKDDATVRPNLFLAYYIYPELLSEDEWISCFDTALKRLWSNWEEAQNITEENHGTSQNYSAKFCDSFQQGSAIFGGLATIDKDHPLFCDVHTGENPASYHHGDSWFWVNNLAAISMLRLAPERYGPYIKGILKASMRDIMERQIIGSCSEVSSASKLSPAGSPLQAWSAATLIELINALNKNH